MLDILAEALDSVSTSYHEFLLRYKANSRVVYGIVEGKEDQIFYRGLIEMNLPEGWEVELIPSGCKENVLKAIAAFDWERFSRRRICFFVDRDLSDFVPGKRVDAENLYVTDNYSVENDMVNFGTLRRILEEVLGIGGLTPDEVAEIGQRFDTGLSCFREALLPIMVQVVQWMRDGRRPCLNDIRPKEYFVFVDGHVKLRVNYETSAARLQHAADCVRIVLSPLDNLIEIEAEFRDRQGAERFIRGKYLLWFMVEFALDVHRSIGNISRRFDRSPKVRVGLGLGNAMVIVAPRVRCPDSLKIFLERNYAQYVGDLI